MKKLILLLAVMGCAKGAEAVCRPYSKYMAECSSGTMLWLEPFKWNVVGGSETYTIDEFVKSGRFCEWRGFHEWDKRYFRKRKTLLEQWVYYDICHFCRKQRQSKTTMPDAR